MENEIVRSAEILVDRNEFALGNDLVFIPDFKTSLTDQFKNKVFTTSEIAYCNQFDDSLLRYASTWAAKEAVYKAIKQLDPAPLPWKKIEIVREKIGGKPQVIIHKDEFKLKISLSISHDGEYAWAIVVIKMGL